MKKDRRSPRGILLAGTSNNNPDLLYATGFRAPDPIVYFQDGSQKAAVVSSMELGRARNTMRGIRVFVASELPIPESQRHRLSGWALGVLRHFRQRQVTVSPQFPLGVARVLEKAKITVHVAEKALLPARQKKRPDELRAIAIAQGAAVAGLRAATRLIASAKTDRDGRLRVCGRVLTAAAVRRVIHRTLLEHDCVGTDTIVAGGRQAADPHCTGAGALRAGEPIVLDIFPQHQPTGYWGDLTRTVLKGRATPELRRMYGAVLRAQGAALASVRAGVPLASIHRAAAEVLERAGFRNGTERGRPTGFIHGTGHGVGLEIHEEPSVSGRSQGRLRAGQVITVEPGLYYPSRGGVRIEDLVVVTRRGYRLLAPCEKKLVVR